MRAWIRRAAVVLGAVLAADQGLQYTALADGKLGGHWVCPFDPPLFTEAQHKNVRRLAAILAGDQALAAESQLDPELGWCPRPGQASENGRYLYDWAGARLQVAPLARSKTRAVRRVVALGGSFTQGAEVAGEESWSALLDARHEDLEVANLGVAGYGVDQALLRFRRDGRPLQPDEVWLGFLPEATLRITTQYPPAYQHWCPIIEFKPCFVLDADGTLRLLPSPARDAREALRLISEPGAFLDALLPGDTWVRRTPLAFGARGSSWLHRFACTRILLSWIESGGRDPAEHLTEPGSEVYRLMRALVWNLATEVRAEGAEFRLVVLPSRPDLRAARAAGTPYWSGLIQELQGLGVECFETTPRLLALGLDADASAWMPYGHYSPAANRLVADALEAPLRLGGAPAGAR